MRAPLQDYPMPATCRLGRGAAAHVGEDARRLGATRALLVTSPHMADMTHARDVARRLREAGVEAVPYEGARRGPDEDSAREGAEAFRRERCDALVSLGGANAHDLAKAIGACARSGRDVGELEGAGRIREPNPPHVAVNTTAGTGAELSSQAFLVSHRRGRPMTLQDPRLTPRVAINDPETHLTMPPRLTAVSGMNALTHAVEAYLSRRATPLSSSMALDAVALVALHLPRAVRDGRDMEARAAMAQAEQLSGLAAHGAGLGLADAMSQSLCMVYDALHGECNAILLPYVLAHDLPVAHGRLARLAETLSGDSPAEADSAPRLARELAASVGIPASLAEAGVDLDASYVCAMGAAQSPLARLDRARTTREDVAIILVEAGQGTPPEEAAEVFAAVP